MNKERKLELANRKRRLLYKLGSFAKTKGGEKQTLNCGWHVTSKKNKGKNFNRGAISEHNIFAENQQNLGKEQKQYYHLDFVVKKSTKMVNVDSLRINPKTCLKNMILCIFKSLES